MSFEPRVVCTAVLTPGAITQRVDRVIGPAAEAKALISRAEQLRRRPMRRQGKNVERDEARGFSTVCISMYPEDLRAVDRRVSELIAAGDHRMSRSKLIRIALRALMAPGGA